MRSFRVFHFLLHMSVASFWAVDSFAVTSTPTVPNNTIGRPSPTRPQGKLKAVVGGGGPRTFLAAGSDATLDHGFDGPALKKLIAFADKNFFLVGLFFAVFTAKIYPSFGVDGGLLHPELFVGKYGVGLIFLLSGLSLQTSALAKAVSNVKLNGLIQLSTFVLWPFMVGLPLRTFLTSVMPNLIPPALADGLLIMTCLPTTVNMCIMLTSSSGGNVATSICNAVLSNLAGIFVTPALLFRFFGTEIRLKFLAMVFTLCKKVLLPVAIGQGLRLTTVNDFYSRHSKIFKRLQEIILLGICFNAFSNAFSSGFGLDLRQTLALLTILPTLHILSLAVLFQFFSLAAFRFSRDEIVAAVFCASHKTLAFGLPLIQTIFQGNVNLAAYCAPVMFIHPLQMIIGSILIPMISRYTSKSK